MAESRGVSSVHQLWMRKSSPQMGGYNIRRANIFNKAGLIRKGEREMLSCPICTWILRDPVQLITCGCRFCQGCLNDIVASRTMTSTSLKCPVDEEVFTLTDIRTDKGCSKELKSLEVDCPMEPDQCDWRGRLTDIEEHEQNCPNVLVQCDSNCGVTFPRSEKDIHATVCSKREELCDYCHTTIVYDQKEDHLVSCPECPITCDFCNESIPTRKEWQAHLDHDCTQYEMNCPFKEVTHCEVKAKKVEMSEHVKENHLITAIEQVNTMKKDVSTLISENEQLRKEVKRRDDLINQLDKRLREVENQFRLQGQRHHSDFVEIDSGAKGRKATRQQKPVTDGGIFDASTSTAVGKLREDLEKSQSQITQLSDSMQVMQGTFTQFGLMVDEVRLRQDVLDVKTSTGVFIWKIPDIRRRYGDAIERRTLSLYSPPFYTSPHGYRMCIRTYLNGDGVGKGSHVSLFFVLMKSEHDSLLPWPFKQPVRFTLINQRNRANDITEAFAPDLTSPSFQRPQSDMNVASGFPRFAKQSVLHDVGFTKDNVIFIKAQVDLNGLNLD